MKSIGSIVVPVLLVTGVLVVSSCRKDPVKNLSGDESRIYNTSTGVFDYGSYWDPYYGAYWDPYYWGYGGYGYYFPSYYYGTYSITEGALSIDIFDLKDAKQTNKISAIWSGLIRGSGV